MSTLDTVKAQLQEVINIANATTGKSDTNITDAVNTLVSGYGQGGNSGSVEVENAFVYATNLTHMFQLATFPSGYELIINAPNFKENADRLVRYPTGLKKVTLKGNVGDNTISLQYGFQLARTEKLEEINFAEFGTGGIKPTYLNNAFSDLTNLHTISGFIDFSSAVNVGNAFNACSALQNVTFKENTLSKSLSLVNSLLLSDTSIQSIIDGLATVETEQTITLHADVKAKLTEEQLASITAKNWSLA